MLQNFALFLWQFNYGKDSFILLFPDRKVPRLRAPHSHEGRRRQHQHGEQDDQRHGRWRLQVRRQNQGNSQPRRCQGGRDGLHLCRRKFSTKGKLHLQRAVQVINTGKWSIRSKVINDLPR